MKNWWHKLYTIPALKMLLLWFGVALACDFIALEVLGSIKVFAAIGYIYPSLYYLLNDKSFESNIEFHKGHINFPELRKMVFTNNFILSSVALILYFVGIAISKKFGVLSLENSPEGEVVIDLLIMAPAMFLPMQYIFHYKNYNMVDSNDGVKSGILFVLIFLFSTVFMLLWFFKFELPVLYFLIVQFVAYFIGNLWFVLKAPFHLENRLNSFKTLFRYQGRGTLVALSLYAVMGLPLYFHLNHASSREFRAFAFNYLGGLSPTLTLSSFKELSDDDSVSRKNLVFVKGQKILSQMDVKQFVEQEGPQKAYLYLKHTRPTHDQLIFLMGYVDKNRNDWSVEDINSFEKLLVKKWPQGHEVPAHLAKHIEVSKRAPAKERGP